MSVELFLNSVIGVFRSRNSNIFRRNRRSQKLARNHVDSLESRVLLTTAASGDQFLVAEAAGFESTPPSVTVQSTGAFTGVWESFEADGSGFGVFAGQFDAEGLPIGPASFQVNTFSAGEQAAPAIAGDEAGNVLIVWQSKGQDNPDGGFGIYGQ